MADASPPNEDQLPEVDPCHRNWVWLTIQFFLSRLFLFWLNYRITGVERLPPGGALLLSNHQSSLDPLLIALTFDRPVSYLARHTLFKIPGIAWILRNTYVMPIRREGTGTESIRLSIQRLEQGYYVGMFPEGTRSEDGTLGRIKPGFLSIVRRVNVPVVPISIAGAGEALPRRAWYLRPTAVRVVINEPFSPEEVAELSQRDHQQQFLEEIQNRIQKGLDFGNEWRKDHSLVPANPKPESSS